MKNKTLLAILLVLIIAVAGIFFLTKDGDDAGTKSDENGEITLEEDGFTVVSTYQDNDTWEYNIKGTLPNPCYALRDEVSIAESTPEQVVLKLSVSNPDDDIACTEVIKEVDVTGEYEADEEATLKVEVTRGAEE
jgi:hypothetical protein